MSVKIYHNPRCSKSRQTLALLEERGIQPEIRRYLDEPLSKSELNQLLKKLGLKATQILRTKEEIYKDLVKKNSGTPDEKLALEWLTQHPKLLERPIVEKGKQARLGRPPELVLEIL